MNDTLRKNIARRLAEGEPVVGTPLLRYGPHMRVLPERFDAADHYCRACNRPCVARRASESALPPFVLCVDCADEGEAWLVEVRERERVQLNRFEHLRRTEHVTPTDARTLPPGAVRIGDVIVYSPVPRSRAPK